ncbi:MAG: glutamine amidotransferase [Sphingomonas bacterium]|nr:glutamine amidotransferase [Sphingomonas bacterium]
MKTALIIRHTPYEGVAGFRLPIEEAGYAIHRIDVLDPAFATVDLIAPDLVVMMGGPMGVYEAEAHPWIACEIERLGQRLRDNRPTLGVCLGAQMIAAALGSRVFPGPAKEIGFAPITIQPINDSPVRHLEGVPVLHWHGDTFDLPDDVELLASTELYANQAFRRGKWLLALQCHPEMGEDPRIETWVEEGGDCLAEAGLDAETILRRYGDHGPAAVAAGRAMIREWIAGLDG